MVAEQLIYTCGHMVVLEEELTPGQRWEIKNILICPACVEDAILQEMA